MKRFFAIILSLALLISLAACGGETNKNAAPGGITEGDGLINSLTPCESIEAAADLSGLTLTPLEGKTLSAASANADGLARLDYGEPLEYRLSAASPAYMEKRALTSPAALSDKYSSALEPEKEQTYGFSTVSLYDLSSDSIALAAWTDPLGCACCLEYHYPIDFPDAEVALSDLLTSLLVK